MLRPDARGIIDCHYHVESRDLRGKIIDIQQLIDGWINENRCFCGRGLIF